MIGMHERVVDSTALFFLLRQKEYGLSAAHEALVSADDQYDAENDSKEQIICRKEKRQKDAHTDPEDDKAEYFFHVGHSPLDVRSLYYMRHKKFISFLSDIGYNNR